MTKNSKDFGSGPDVAPELQSELLSLGFDPRAVLLFPDLKTFNDTMVRPLLERRRLADVGFDLKAWVAATLPKLLQDPTTASTLLGVENVEVLVDEIGWFTFEDVRLTDLHLLPSGDHLADVQVKATFTLPYRVELGAYLADERVRALVRGNLGNAGWQSAEVHSQVTADLHIRLLIDKSSREVRSADIDPNSSLEILRR